VTSTPQPDDHRPQSTGTARKRARVLIPLAFVTAIVLVMVFILLVQWVGR
jgi:hypothetical protein